MEPSGQLITMSFFSELKRKQIELRRMRTEQIEQRRVEATLAAAARGATPEQARRAGDRAARGNTNAAITGSLHPGG
ncbi:hypothetical protein IGW14_22790 [Streptomyces hygroscopicus subsp. hygroscopicus]|nr:MULTISPECIES: hypothetical protein [Streptomyces]MBW8090771.1 hypothetical protein [Streptomyces hygroscopicus subsp. hygroscopicus]MDN3058121.1 hypothetical protein [Streptomyces sp. SRF1]